MEESHNKNDKVHNRRQHSKNCDNVFSNEYDKLERWNTTIRPPQSRITLEILITGRRRIRVL